MEKIGRYPEPFNVQEKPLTEKLETTNKQEQSDLLDQAIFAIQLFQADREYQLAGQVGNLSDSFDNFKHFTDDLQTAARLAAEKKQDSSQTDIIYQGYLKEIDRIYQSLPAYHLDQAYNEQYFQTRKSELTAVTSFINEIISKAKQERPELFIDDRSTNERAGLLDYNLLQPTIISGREHNPVLAEILKKQGVSPLDNLLQIHFQPLFKQEGTGNRLAKIKDSLAELAKVIVDKYPQVQGVTGTSWLLDNEAVCRLIGFKAIGQVEYGNWNQLIDHTGQINQERLSQLVKTGHLPMKNVIGYISVVDFLQKFLPSEYRGVVNLVKLDSNWAEDYNNFKNNFQIERQQLLKLFIANQINSEAELRQQLDHCTTFKMILSQAGVLDDFIELLDKHNYQLNQIEKNSPQETKIIAEKINNLIVLKQQKKEISYQVEIN
ncbi:MAG TPA: hypothetical protein PLA53_01125 [bacterium]|jgi:hypothetical protein|nr:hypothetical protein [bacterium]HNZ51273.1 hypothetical protein [bacterium]HOF79941.1 hypothetical protein [bacterium]HOH85168.1 hypothetical protein [bacterium]HOQ91584.1 hypothetical protein [bacterium]